MTATVQQILEFISQESPLDVLDTELLTEIAQTSHLIYLAEENQDTLLKEYSNCLYLIQNGQFAVKDSESPIKHLSDGDYFGYPSLLDKVDYGLKVVVDSPGIVVCIDAKYFAQALEHQAFALFFSASKNDALQNQAVADSNSMWLYKPLFEVVQNTPITIGPGESVQSAAKLMSDNKASSVLIMQGNDLLGVMTDRDLRNRVVAQGFNTQLPVKQIMTENPAFLTKNKTIFDAICVMNEKGIHHLPILDARTGMPFGMITNTDISRQQRANVLFVVSDLSKSQNTEELATNAWQVPQYLASTAKRAGDFDLAGKVMAQATDIMTRKLISFFQQEHGQAPMAFCWLVYGSQAREDQTMGSDQDNALLLADEPNAEQAEYFEALASFVCIGLGKCGIKLCDGNIMASNPKLRLSLAASKAESERWVRNPSNEAMLEFNIFLDVRVVAGDNQLFKQLQEHRKPLFKQAMFLAALARNANEASVPLSMFQKFVYAKGQPYKDSIDIKKSAVAIINNIVRMYALGSGLTLPGTVARLNNLPADSGLSPKDRQNLRDIWLLLNRLRWRHQLTNEVDDNFVRVSDLSSIEKHQLKAAFQAIHRSQQAVVLRFSGGIG
jgi:CBS domain-containing protein